MGISAALGNSLSGLKATSVQSDLIAKNISNANTEGYTRKEAKLVSIGGNVTVASIDRQVSGMLDRLDRGNHSKLSGQQTIIEGVSAYTDYLGQPEDAASPSALLSEVKSSVVALTGSVNDGAAQLAVVSAAKEFASQMNRLSDTVDAVGKEVELNIAYDVSELNSALYEVARLNTAIIGTPSGSAQAVQLQDDMGRALDQISGLMDIQTVTSNTGMVSVLTGGGSELVSGKTVYDVKYVGATGTLTAGDVNITPNSGSRAFSDGSIAGLFDLKTEILPEFHAQLDALASATIEGFERVAPITADGRGLFTDAGGAYNAAAVSGLASRINVNPDADRDLGGSASILQNGSNPAVPAGDNSLAIAMSNLFNEAVAVPTQGLGANPTLTMMTATLVGGHQQVRVDYQQAAKTTEVAASTISSSRLNLQGVNIDDELQKLLLVEQSYAANAKVLTTVSSMLDTLLDAVR